VCCKKDNGASQPPSFGFGGKQGTGYNVGGHRPPLRSVPTMIVPTPVTASIVVSVAAVTVTASVRPILKPIVADAWTEEDADANWRKEGHRARRRWRRVIVTASWCLVRLNHICAGVRTESSSKPEREHRQCHDEIFPSHNRIVPPVVLRD